MVGQHVAKVSGAIRPEESLSEQLASYWADARFEDLPGEVVHAAKRFLLDTLAAGVAGGRTEVVDSVVAAMRAGGSGSGEAILWRRRPSIREELPA